MRNQVICACAGNHERDWPGTGTRFETARDSGGECGRVLDKRFPMPPPAPGNGWRAALPRMRISASLHT